MDDRRRARRASATPPSGPTTRSATSGSTGCAACPPSAAGGRGRHAGPRLPRLARLADRRASTRRSTRTSTIERVARTDARVIVCGHTHLPEVRDLGWKLIVNAGSAGYVFDGEPTASWALVDIDGDEVTAEIRRTEFDALAVANAISARGLPGDVYRAATVRTGKLVR